MIRWYHTVLYHIYVENDLVGQMIGSMCSSIILVYSYLWKYRKCRLITAVFLYIFSHFLGIFRFLFLARTGTLSPAFIVWYHIRSTLYCCTSALVYTMMLLLVYEYCCTAVYNYRTYTYLILDYCCCCCCTGVCVAVSQHPSLLTRRRERRRGAAAGRNYVGHGDRHLCASIPDAVAVLLGDSAVRHPVCDGGDGCDGAVLHWPVLLELSGSHQRDELGHCHGGVRLHSPGSVWWYVAYDDAMLLYVLRCTVWLMPGMQPKADDGALLWYCCAYTLHAFVLSLSSIHDISLPQSIPHGGYGLRMRTLCSTLHGTHAQPTAHKCCEATASRGCIEVDLLLFHVLYMYISSVTLFYPLIHTCMRSTKYIWKASWNTRSRWKYMPIPTRSTLTFRFHCENHPPTAAAVRVVKICTVLGTCAARPFWRRCFVFCRMFSVLSSTIYPPPVRDANQYLTSWLWVSIGWFDYRNQ